MKKTMFLSCLMCMMAVGTKAQLLVGNNGHIVIGDTITTSSRMAVNGANGTGIETKGTIGISASSVSSISGGNFGVKAMANNSSTVNVGVYAYLGSNATKGVAVLGCSSTSIPSFTGKYAGIFSRNVRVLGHLYATLATSSVSSQVATYIESAEESFRGTESVTNRLCKLKTVGYYEPEIIEKTEVVGTNSVLDQYTKKFHYGLAVDQLKEVYPELVIEDPEGNACINYIELIPLLLQYVNELNIRIKELEGESERAEVGEILQKTNKSLSTSKDVDTTILLSLGQNDPNPFSEQTSIEVSVPESVTSATLLIFDMQGKQVKRIDIADRGTSRITVMGQGLPEGMYLYSLVADGKVVKTRKMILSK